MSQRMKKADTRNEFKSSKSYLASIQSSCSKDDLTSKIRSVSYSSGDQEIRYKSSYKSTNCHAKKLLKSPLVLRKTDSINNFELKRSSNSFNKHKRKHHHCKDHFLISKDSTMEKHLGCHTIFNSDKNKRVNESSREKKSRTLDCESFRRFSSDRYSLCNSFNSERKKKDHPKRSTICNPVSNDIGRNRMKDKRKDKNENEGNIKESIEGSARTRGFKLKKKEGAPCIQSRKNINCTKIFAEENFLKGYEKLTENLNFDNHDFGEPSKRKKCVSNTIKPKKGSKSRLRKEKNVENSSKQSFEVKLDKNKKVKKNYNEEIKFTDAKTELVLSTTSSPTTEIPSKAKVNQENSRKSSKDRQKKFKIDKEIKNSTSATFNSENDASKERKVQTVISVSEMKIEDKNRRMIEEIKKSKNNKRKGNGYKNSRPPFNKRRTLRYLIYLIRKIIVSDREENNNEDRDKKLGISKENSCIRIKLENEIESGCESSGYHSLQNIQDRLSEINNVEYAEKKIPHEIEFLDSDKYCVYKIYKSIDGAIVLKESQNQEFKEGEYVIGKRILKESERLLPLLKNTISDKNINQSSSQRHNSTQTELNLTSKQNRRKKRWFNKSYTKKCQGSSKKYFSSLESTSNTSFPESSDVEQCQIPFTKTMKKIYSSSSKEFLSNFPKSSAHSSKNFTAVDTSDLNYFTPVKIPKDKMVFLFTNSGNEKSLESLVLKNNRHLNLDTTALSNKKTLEKSVSSNIFDPKIPVSKMNMHNTEFIAQKINMEEMIRVQMDNSYNFIQPSKIQINKPDLMYSEGNSKDKRLKKQTKSFKKFCGIFTRKKNDKIKFKEKLRM